MVVAVEREEGYNGRSLCHSSEGIHAVEVAADWKEGEGRGRGLASCQLRSDHHIPVVAADAVVRSRRQDRDQDRISGIRAAVAASGMEAAGVAAAAKWAEPGEARRAQLQQREEGRTRNWIRWKGRGKGHHYSLHRLMEGQQREEDEE